MTNECIDPIDLFRTEAYHDDIQVQIRAVKKLPTLAVALDVERTRHELIPVLEDYVDVVYFQNDELLVVLAEQLGKLLPFIGGAEYAFLLFPMLEKLAAADDMKPREKAVEALQNLASSMNGMQIEDHFVKIIYTMSEAEWFTSKCSAAGLVAVCYPKLSETGKKDLRDLFLSLVENESPMVKREAAKYFSDFIKIVEMDYLKEEFIPSFRKLSKDDQDSVRLLAVNVAVALASRLTPKEIEEDILETLHSLCVDSAWRVRYQFANEINTIQTAVGPAITRKTIVQLYKILVRDTEANIREISARNIVQFCEILQKSYQEENKENPEDLDPVIKREILPLINELDKDVAEDVQDGLYSVIISLSSLLGEINTKDFLLPLITSSIENDSSKVKENIIANLNNIICVIGIEDLTETVQKLMRDLVNTTIWRTRRNLIVTLCHIARHSKKEYFNEHLKPLYVNLLNDTVYGVRKVAPLILPVLVKHFGMTWAKEHIVQTYLEFSEKTYYLLRLMCLFGMDELIFPSLEGRADDFSYLEVLKDKDDAVSSKIVNRLKNLNEVLSVQLQEQWVGIVLNYIEDENYFNDDIKSYAEETIEAFAKCGELEIGSISCSELENRKSDETYVEGLLFLILAYFLDKIHILAQDKVYNVRIRAANTLQKIYDFNKALRKELDEPWVEKLMGLTSLEERVMLMQDCRNELLNAVKQKNKQNNYNDIDQTNNNNNSNENNEVVASPNSEQDSASPVVAIATVEKSSPMEVEEPPVKQEKISDEEVVSKMEVETTEKTADAPVDVATKEELDKQVESSAKAEDPTQSLDSTDTIAVESTIQAAL